jgi:hypothetical protein
MCRRDNILNIVINYHPNKLNMEGLNKNKGIIQQGTRDDVHEMCDY